MKHAAGGVAVDGDVGRAGAEDAQVVGDEQFAGGQRDRAVGAGGEHDDVFAGTRVGILNRLSQTAGATVVGVDHRVRERRDGQTVHVVVIGGGAAGVGGGVAAEGRAEGAGRAGENEDRAAFALTV